MMQDVSAKLLALINVMLNYKEMRHIDTGDVK